MSMTTQQQHQALPSDSALRAQKLSDKGPHHFANLLVDSTLASAWQSATFPLFVASKVTGISKAQPLPHPNMRGKVAVISGGYKGVGRKTSDHLARTGITLVLASRDTEAAESARREMLRLKTVDGQPPDVQVMELDLLQPHSIEKFASDFKSKFEQLNILVNDAGTNIPGITEAGLDYVFTASYLGHWYLTSQLYDTIKGTPDARVVNVSSVLHRYGSTKWWQAGIGERGSDNYFNALGNAYCDAKFAHMIFTNELRMRFEKDGASAMAFAVSPGNVKTDVWRAVPLLLRIPTDLLARVAFLTSEEGCHTSVMAALADFKELGGEKSPALYLQPYWGPSNKRPWDVAGFFGGTIPTVATLPPNVEKEGQLLWETSMRLIKEAKEGTLPHAHYESRRP